MKKGFLKFMIVISFLVAFLLIPKSAYALTVKVEKSIDTIKPGGEVTVSIKASDVGSDPISSYKFSLNYDTSKLDFRTSSSDISDISGTGPITIQNKSGSSISSDVTFATLVFQAKSNAKAGDANLTLSCEDTENCTSQSSMVKVASLSTDATLSSLKIPNATISPKFDKNTTEYKTTIQDITEITVNAVASDSNSKIMISDNYKNLQKGENEIKITVTAEDGKTTKTYKVVVTLKLTPTEEEVKKANTDLKKLEVEGYELDFDKTQKKYSLTVPYKITKVNVLAEAENEKATIEMEGNTTLKVGRNTIKVNVISEDEENKDTYTLNITRQEQEKKVVQTCPDTTSSREWIIYSASLALTFTLGIVLGYFLCKKEVLKKIFKKKDKKEKNKKEELSNTIEIKTEDINNEIKKD